MIKAVIDIGTNTAHLLIAQVIDDNDVSVILKNRHYTYLGYQGLDSIGLEAINRLLNALSEFQSQIKEHEVQTVRVIATDALRSANNGNKIQEKIINQFSWQPEIITGDQEANLIANGVQLSLPKHPDHYLIMDIGGGSVEFILYSLGTQIIAQSLPLGISRLYNYFQLSDPPKPSEIELINEHIQEKCTDIFHAIANINANITLIGSAGTFETFLSPQQLIDHSIKSVSIPIDFIKQRYQEVISTRSELFHELDWLPSARKQYIVVAFILMNAVLSLSEIDEVIISKYALKEGTLVQKENN